MMEAPALRVTGLRAELQATGGSIVQDVSLTLDRGEILGLVGESGSGKTTTALALLGFSRPGVVLAAGSVKVAGNELLGRSERELCRLRGRLVSYVPQDPSVSLNPARRVGSQLRELAETHFPDRDARAAVAAALERVHLPADRAFQRRFPHQLSGGQQQRVTIAMALLGEPSVAVLDEPTTGLDVCTQARILEEVTRLRTETGTAMVYVTHNLAVVGAIADRIAVMYAGWIIEEGPAHELLRSPRHPYTRGLVSSVPDHAVPRQLRGLPGVAVGVGDRPAGCPFAPRCPQKPRRADDEMPPVEEVRPGHRVRCFEWRATPPLELQPTLASSVAVRREAPLLEVNGLRAEYRTKAGLVVAADEVWFSVRPAQSVALVGESGSGKTTIARCVAGLHAPSAGTILFDRRELAPLARVRTRDERRRIQIVFQNPYDSLNPRQSVGMAIARPARLLRGLGRRAARTEAAELLERVRLPARLADRYPRELSGGERQRVAIARALAARPELLICDEVTSALDVSVQAAVLELLAQLRTELGLALLFISHDLGVVASVSDHVLVLHQGVVREQGPAARLLASPHDPYTQSLVEAAPRLPEPVAVSG